MSADLSKRQRIADHLRESLAACLSQAEVQDILALLLQWQAGTLHGIPAVVPAPDPSRPLSQYPHPK